MSVFVLVHGMWHGGWSWKKVTPLLQAAGHVVYTPTLTGLGERVHLPHAGIDLATHIQDVVNVFEYEDLSDVILVGHSFGGSLASVIADKIPHRIAHLVNLDGPLPEDGKSLMVLVSDFWDFFSAHAIVPGDEERIQPIADWTFGVSGPDLAWLHSKLTPHPVKPLTTPVSLANAAANDIPRTYIHCTEGLSPDAVAEEEERYSSLGWRYRTIPTGHDAMITTPDELVGLLLECV